MPSLHKRPESPFWIASFTDARGRRLKKSTKTESRTLATKMATEWEKASKAARAKQLVESQCRRVLSELHQQSTGAPIHFISCADWLAQWLAGRRGVTTEKTFVRYERVTADFLAHLDRDRADAPLSTITKEEITAFRDTLLERGMALATVEAVIQKDLATPFTVAHRLGYITIHPCTGLETPPPLPEVKPKAAPKPPKVKAEKEPKTTKATKAKKKKKPKAKAKKKETASEKKEKAPKPAKAAPPEPVNQLSFGF